MNAHEMYNGIKILLLLLLVASLIVTGASVRAQQDGVLLNATMGLVTTHLTFSSNINYPSYITDYYNGLNALQLIYPGPYSYGGVAWLIYYNDSIIRVSVLGLYTIMHVAAADGFTIILFPANGSGVTYSNYSIPLFTASSSTEIGGNLELPYSTNTYVAVQWDPFYGTGNQFNLYVVQPPDNLVVNIGGIGCSIGIPSPGQVINFTVIYVPQLNELFIYVMNEETGRYCSFPVNLDSYNFTPPPPGKYWVMVESDTGEYYANWALVFAGYSYVSTQEILGSLIIKVMNALNNNPINNAFVYIRSLNESCVTTALGLCQLTNLEPGTYTMFVDKEGFENSTEIISITPGIKNVTVWLLPMLATPTIGYKVISYSSNYYDWLLSDVSGMSSIFTNGFAPMGIGVYGVGYVNNDYVGYEYKYDYVVATMIVTKPLNYTTWNAGFYPVSQSQAIIDMQLNFYLVIKLVDGQYQYYWLQNVIGIHYPGEVLIGPPGAFNNTALNASFTFESYKLSNAQPAVLGYINNYPFVAADIARICQVTPTFVTVCFGYNIGNGTVWYSNMTLYPYTTISNAYFEVAPHGAGVTPQLDLAFVLTGGYSPGQVYGELLSGEIMTNVIIHLVNGTWIVPQDAWNVGTGTAEEAQAIDSSSNFTTILTPGIMKNLTMLWSLPLEVNVTVINPDHIPIGIVNGTYLGGLAIGSYSIRIMNSTTACEPTFNVTGDYLFIPWLNVTGGYVLMGPSTVYVDCIPYYNVTIVLPTGVTTEWIRGGSTFTYMPPLVTSNSTVEFFVPYTIYLNGKTQVSRSINITVNGPNIIFINYTGVSYRVNFVTPAGVYIPGEWINADTVITVSGPQIKTSMYMAYPVISKVLVNKPMNITVVYNANSTIVVRDYLGLPAPGVSARLVCGTKVAEGNTNAAGVVSLSIEDVPTVNCSVVYTRPFMGYYSILLIAVLVVIALIIALRLISHRAYS